MMTVLEAFEAKARFDAANIKGLFTRVIALDAVSFYVSVENLTGEVGCLDSLAEVDDEAEWWKRQRDIV